MNFLLTLSLEAPHKPLHWEGHELCVRVLLPVSLVEAQVFLRATLEQLDPCQTPSYRAALTVALMVVVEQVLIVEAGSSVAQDIPTLLPWNARLEAT